MNDVEQIKHTLALFPRKLDTSDAVAWSRLFTEEGFFVSAGGGEYRGRPAIRKFGEEMFAGAADRQTMHCDSDYTVEINGDSASAFADVVVFERFGIGPWRIKGVNHYIDHLVQLNGEWLIAERRVSRVWMATGEMNPPRW